MGFVGNYAPCGLSPQTNGMPVILKKAPPRGASITTESQSVMTGSLIRLIHIRKPLHRLGKIGNGLVCVPMFNSVPHAVLDMSL